MYKKIDYRKEIQYLKEQGVRAWSGEKQKYLTVTVNTEEGSENYKYFFPTANEYTKFINKLRRLME